MPHPDPISLPPANTLEPPEPSTPEERTPMLDVHPAHHAATTWRDFFIHIATIVLGLLIAVGIEQTVEYIHHRHQIADAREALRIEHEQNRIRYRLFTQEFYRQKDAVQTNLASLLYLQQHPGISAAKLPNKIVWHIFYQHFNDSAWQSAQRSGVIALMPQDEVRHDAGFYVYLDKVAGATASLTQSFAAARRYLFQDADPSHLTPAQIAEQIDLTKTVLVNLYGQGTYLRNLSIDYKEFGPAPTSAELLGMMHDTDMESTLPLIQKNLEQQRLADELKDSTGSPSQ